MLLCLDLVQGLADVERGEGLSNVRRIETVCTVRQELDGEEGFGIDGIVAAEGEIPAELRGDLALGDLRDEFIVEDRERAVEVGDKIRRPGKTLGAERLLDEIRVDAVLSEK